MNTKIELKAIKNMLKIALIAICCLSACTKDDRPATTSSKTFVLVHGAWQGAWVWDSVKSEFEKKGQKVIVVELPAHGNDQTPAASASINAYRDKVVTAINSVNGKVILVGHSMGGMVVSAVAEAIPDRIEKLVYIGAFLPVNGQSLLDLAALDSQSLLGPNIVPSADQLTLDIKKDAVTDIFCQDGSADIKALTISKFKIEPAIPFADKAALSAAKFGKVDKYYIHTLQDHAVGINLQYQMVKAAGINKTYSLNSSHCPFLTMPANVVSKLMDIIK